MSLSTFSPPFMDEPRFSRSPSPTLRYSSSSSNTSSSTLPPRGPNNSSVYLNNKETGVEIPLLSLPDPSHHRHNGSLYQTPSTHSLHLATESLETTLANNLRLLEERRPREQDRSSYGEGRVVRFEEGEEPQSWSTRKKWLMTLSLALQTFVASFGSAAYSGGARAVLTEFRTTQEIVALGISLYVLGFALGPIVFAPLSEVYGRRPIFLVAFGCFTLSHLGGALAKNLTTLLVLRFFSGAFASNPLTNSPAGLSDMFNASDRGPPVLVFICVIFLGPLLSPIAGGFLEVETGGWRNIFWLLFALSVPTYIIGCFTSETYAPALLRSKAKRLSKSTGQPHVPSLDVLPPGEQKPTLSSELKTALFRPLTLLFTEPIVLFISVWVSIVYGTLYLLFAAFPVVFQLGRGWNTGVGSLPFLGVAFGVLLSAPVSLVVQKNYLRRVALSSNNIAPPEARLTGAMLGGILVPLSLLIFAWTVQRSIHWILPVIVSIPFGLGMILIFLSSLSYLLDSFAVYSASVMASNCILRSLFAAVFPEFSPSLFRSMSPSWALTLVASLSLLCAPLPFLFYRYGPAIRQRSKIAREVERKTLEEASTREGTRESLN